MMYFLVYVVSHNKRLGEILPQSSTCVRHADVIFLDWNCTGTFLGTLGNQTFFSFLLVGQMGRIFQVINKPESFRKNPFFYDNRTLVHQRDRSGDNLRIVWNANVVAMCHDFSQKGECEAKIILCNWNKMPSRLRIVTSESLGLAFRSLYFDMYLWTCCHEAILPVKSYKSLLILQFTNSLNAR